VRRILRSLKGGRLQGAGFSAGLSFLRVLLRTVRLRPLDKRSRLWGEKPPRNVIYSFWHAKLLAPLYSHRDKGIGVMISHSRDGEIIARIAEALGFEPVRGSTSRGGKGALKRMVELARAGRHLAFTPDGPRGPRHQYQMGAIYLARLTGLPLVNVGIAYTRHWTLPSWDRFEIPKPGATTLYRVDEPVYVTREFSKEEFETLRLQLEERLKNLTEEAERRARALARR